jgi:hypothetical protein
MHITLEKPIMSMNLTPEDLLCIKQIVKAAILETAATTAQPAKSKNPVYVPEACKITGCTEYWLRSKLNSGLIKGYKTGKGKTCRWRVFPEDITRYMTSVSNSKRRVA